ncbi:unnamed protein product [Peronospora destructor]|uniref:Polyprotein n=1 Tax=Peronospora destructor TaxID=86335 RepID=A0AAV0VD22_9STRA|nr:unnamed protein product [Peronospora destructor]
MIVGWLCKKQGSVALSTMEAEFVAGSLVASELLGMYELLDEIGIKVEVPNILHIDNQAAIKQITGEDSSGRAKHIAVRYKFVKDYSKKGVIKVAYCESMMMRADVLTKTLAASRLRELRELVSLV